MEHIDDTDLALAALGGPLAQTESVHLATCPECLAELQSFAAVAELGPSTATVSFAEPPAALWDAIAEQRAIDDSVNVRRLSSGSKPAQARWNSARWLGLAAAVVVGVCLGAVGVFALTGTAADVQVASADLQALPPASEAGTSGTARVERSGASEYLAVHTSPLTTPAGYYEAWLLNPVSGEMIAVGTVPSSGAEVRLPLPAGVDFTAYSAVDISDEPWDGDPVHSKVSVLRGTLEA